MLWQRRLDDDRGVRSLPLAAMRIDHVAIWTADLERLRAFYCTHLGAVAGAKYVNPRKGFESYFLSFADGPRLELMTVSNLGPHTGQHPAAGYAHLALSVGSEEAVGALAGELRAAGVPVVDGPRRTGDGYYECVVLDPDGNRIEFTA